MSANSTAVAKSRPTVFLQGQSRYYCLPHAGGVIETLEARARAGAACIGAGVNERGAYSPVILMAGEWRVGLLGHYWNLRLGADVVIGHHPHIIQPFEIHRGCPIFYSVGNFTFGSRNSRAEGLLIGTRFEESQNLVNTYPLYVKNRDPRVNYHWRIFRGQRAVTSKSRGDAESFTSTVHL